MTPQHLLVTGGAGFIGSNFVRHVLAHHDEVWITNVDALTYSGTLASLAGIDNNSRYRFVHGDIRDQKLVSDLLNGAAGNAPIDSVVNFAAWSHVDRAILNPLEFVDPNVNGTAVLLESSRQSLKARASKRPCTGTSKTRHGGSPFWASRRWQCVISTKKQEDNK